MTDPLVYSHNGKAVHVHADGSKTNLDGSPVVDPVDKKPPPAPPKRWHDPYV